MNEYSNGWRFWILIGLAVLLGVAEGFVLIIIDRLRARQ